jgi:hypothetical protein
MADIFFSYSSLDRDRVRPIYQALSEQGFDIFWDQSVPAGTDWDRWIRQHLNDAKCAIVFWSVNSVASDNVRHEATVAKQRGKLVPVLLDPLTAEQFPMGSYSTQGANLSAWSGEIEDVEWSKIQRELEARLTPIWLRRIVDRLEAELIAERARREAADRRDRALRDQIVKEVQAQEELRRELQQAHEEIVALKAQASAQAAAARDSAASDRQNARTSTDSRTDTPAGAHDRHTTNAADRDRSNEPAGVNNAADPERAVDATQFAAGFSLKSPTGMLSIAAVLVALTVVLLPAGLSFAGALALLLPAAGLAGTVYYLRYERRTLDAADRRHDAADA